MTKQPGYDVVNREIEVHKWGMLLYQIRDKLLIDWRLDDAFQYQVYELGIEQFNFLQKGKNSHAEHTAMKEWQR